MYYLPAAGAPVGRIVLNKVLTLQYHLSRLLTHDSH